MTSSRRGEAGSLPMVKAEKFLSASSPAAHPRIEATSVERQRRGDFGSSCCGIRKERNFGGAAAGFAPSRSSMRHAGLGGRLDGGWV
ncbi:unnamed protein product, partial [Urochloa humidicola]